MTDDARRALSEEVRGRIQAAKTHGRTCARCGRGLAGGEPVWIERLVVVIPGRRRSGYRAPVGAECASPAFRAATEGIEPAPCAACGRGVHDPLAQRRRWPAACSRRCAGRYYLARAKERGA